MSGREIGEAWSQVAADLEPRSLLSTVAIGLVLAMVNSLLSVALMSLIFSGSLADQLSVAIAVGLITSAIVAMIVAMKSGFAGMYGGIQDSSAAILAVAAMGVAASVSSQARLATVFVVLVLASLATGAALLLMARFKLGEIARFVPYPVIGGLIAGTGYLITVGAIGILTSVYEPFELGALGLLWPGVALAGLLFLSLLKKWPPHVYLTLIVVSILGFHLATALGGVDRVGSFDKGWLLGPLPRGLLWNGFGLEAFTGADWGLVLGQLGAIAAVVLIVPLTILLSIGALETDRTTELDINRELRATGWANIAGGALGGGPPGYFYLADTLIAHRLVGGRRGPPLVAAVAILSTGLFGGAVLELLPRFIVGSLLLFVGVDFLYDWLWVARKRMTGPDYTMMVGIVVVIAIVGLLPGVIAGMTAAVGLFVFRYSQISVVKHTLTGADGQSNIDRDPAHAEYLQVHGNELVALELQGFVFFGTAYKIFTRVNRQFESQPDLRFLILDFRLTTGADSSAVSFFERIVAAAELREVGVVITGMSPSTRVPMASLLEKVSVHEETDLDHGMAWCEDQILGAAAIPDASRSVPDKLLACLDRWLVDRTFMPGDRLMIQGDVAPGIFLIEAGVATVSLDSPTGPAVRLRTLHEGTVLGEISLYRGEVCTATVTADTKCEVKHLTPDAFAEMCRVDPETSAELHVFVARILAGRVDRANKTIRALHD